MDRERLIQALESALAMIDALKAELEALKAEEPVAEKSASPTDEMISLNVSGDPSLYAKMKPTYDPAKEPWDSNSWMLYGMKMGDNRKMKPVEVQLEDGPVMARPCGDPSKGGWFANKKYWFKRGYFQHEGQWYKRVK